MSRSVAIKQKLKDLAVATKTSVDFIQTRYVADCLITRLSVLYATDREAMQRYGMCIKGGIMIPVMNDGDMYRATSDVDFNGFNPDGDVDELREVMTRVAAMRPLSEGGELEFDDGLVFEVDTMEVRKERDGAIPGGKIALFAKLDTSRIRLRVDVGYGNPIYPEPEMVRFPTLLRHDKKAPHPQPEILAYTPYTFAAEKIDCAAFYGLSNTRIRDYYDLYFLAEHKKLDTTELAKAILQTFTFRGREIQPTFDGLSEEFGLINEAVWRKYNKKGELKMEVPDLCTALVKIREMVEPALQLALEMSPDSPAVRL